MSWLTWLIANFVIAVVIALVVFLVLGTVFLMIGLGAVSSKNKEFGTIFVTNLIGAILMVFIPCLGVILYWYIIKTRHETTWGGAIGAWLISIIVPIIILLAVFFLVLGLSLTGII
jgi:hypothetical protein